MMFGMFDSLQLQNAVMIVAVAAAASIPCAMLGCFLILKRMSLLADAVSHGVLPGIVLAALFSGVIAGWPVLAGAIVFGVITAAVAQWLNLRARVAADASLGVAFTAIFAFGVLLLSIGPLRRIHLDIHCIAFSTLEVTPTVTNDWFGIEIPSALWPSLGLTILVAGQVAVFWKELTLATFDPGLAATLGMPVAWLHYLIVGLTAAATVSAFDAFGSILVVGMFVIPPATARLVTDRLGPMMAWSVAAAVNACVIGYLISFGNVSGMIILAAGAQFFLALAFAPQHGLIARAWRRGRLVGRMAEEEILATLYRAEEKPGHSPAPSDHAFSPAVLTLARWNLRRRHLLDAGRLTEEGRRKARSIVRAHRLWEAFLEKNFELPLDHLHASATEIEHYLGPELQARLAAELGDTPSDPHGRSIPE